jgi:hypothetical protein
MQGPATSLALLLMMFAVFFELDRGGRVHEAPGGGRSLARGSLLPAGSTKIPLPQALAAALLSLVGVFCYEILPAAVREWGRFSAQPKA